MCGIFGYYTGGGQAQTWEQCRRATSTMEHRGPDDYGEHVARDGCVFLGFRRLSILDLSEHGHQPMVGRGGNAIVFNGEIFNYRDLRNLLMRRGVRFQSTGDTEVLLRGIEEFGPEFIDRLEGMFAFIYYDAEKNTLLLCRDQFGIKPLYIWTGPRGQFAVASEIKAFACLSDYEFAINTNALPEYLRYRSLCSEQTLYKNVELLGSGIWREIGLADGATKNCRYWKLLDRAGEAIASRSDMSPRALSRLLCNSIHDHMIADVPIGTQFSGGVDSGLIAAIASRYSSVPITGFFCSVQNSFFDEEPYADSMGNFIDMELAKTEITPSLFFSSHLERLTWHMDEPMGHPNAMGINRIAEIAKGRVKVLLSGEGADEFFGGYVRYSRLLMSDALRKMPRKALHVIALMRQLRSSGSSLGALVDNSLERTAEEDIVCGSQFVTEEAVSNLLRLTDAKTASNCNRWALFNAIRTGGLLDRAQTFDTKAYLEPLLMRQDKMSMAASIENRVPFVTPSVFKAALSLSEKQRATMRKQKVVLKNEISRYYPQRLLKRRKWGFGVPLSRWFGDSAGRERLNTLRENGCALHGILDKKAILRLVSSYDGSGSNAEVLWLLLSIDVWLTTTREGYVGRAVKP